MMDYESFKGLVAERFKEFLPERLSGCKAEIRPVYKINREEDAVVLVRPDLRDTQSSPLIYISDMYERYRETGDVRYTLSEAAGRMEALWRDQYTERLSLDEIRGRIVMELVNTEMNGSLLREVPSRPFNDLSIIYKIVSSVEPGAVWSSRVTNSLAKQMGMDEPELYEAAYKNTKRLFPPMVIPIEGMVKMLYENAGEALPAELDRRTDGAVELLPFYVVTNKNNIDGAVSVLYEDVLHGLAGRLGADLYLLPSSINEMIALPAKDIDPRELAGMVEDINMVVVPTEEQLSNQVYQYDRELRKVFPAPAVPARGIGMDIVEPSAISGIKGQAR